VAISNSASPEIIRGLEDLKKTQLHHSCWTGRVGEQEEEDWKSEQLISSKGKYEQCKTTVPENYGSNINVHNALIFKDLGGQLNYKFKCFKNIRN